MNDLKKNFSNLIEIIFQSFSARLIFLISSIISAIVTYRFLSIEQRGLLSVLLAFHTISFGLSFYAGSVIQSKVAILSKTKDFLDLKIYVWSVYFFRIVTLICISFFLFLLSNYILSIIPEIQNANNIQIVATLLLIKILEGPFNENILFGLNYLKSITKYYLVKSVALIISLLSLIFFDLNPISYLIIFLILDLIFTSPYLWIKYFEWSKAVINNLNYNIFAKLFINVLKKYLSKGFSVWLMSFLFICSSNISILFIAKFASLQDTAIYSLLISLNMMIFSFPTRYETYALTFLSKRKIENIKNFNELVFNQFHIFLITILIVYFFWLIFSSIVIELAFGGKYEVLKELIFFISLFIPFRSLTFFRNIFYIYEDSNQLLILVIIKYAIEFFLYFTLIPIFGIYGAIISLIVSFFIYGFTILIITNYKFLKFSKYNFIRICFSITFLFISILYIYFINFYIDQMYIKTFLWILFFPLCFLVYLKLYKETIHIY